MISVDSFKMNKADRTHHQLRTPAPKKNSRKAPGIRKKMKKSGGSSPLYRIKKSSQTDEGLQLKITARENETEKMQKEKVVLTVQEDIAAETRTVKLNQDAATIEYDSYKMDSYSLLFYPLIGYENIVYAVIRCYKELIQFFFRDFQCISEEAIGQYNSPAFINPKESYLYTLLFLYYNDKPGKPKQSISHTVSIR